MDMGLFPPLVVTNNASVNIHIQVFICTCIFMSLGCVSRCRIAGSYGNSNMVLNGTVSHREKSRSISYQGVGDLST